MLNIRILEEISELFKLSPFCWVRKVALSCASIYFFPAVIFTAVVGVLTDCGDNFNAINPVLDDIFDKRQELGTVTTEAGDSLTFTVFDNSELKRIEDFKLVIACDTVVRFPICE